MRRAGELFDGMVRFDHLVRSARRAARGKRRSASAARFLERLEPNVLALRRALIAGTWRPGKPATFEVRDPKVRTISAAPFADRVVHHAIMDRLEPVFDRRMVFESFACRTGKGTHAALRHARRMLRRHGWFLKLDVRKCFDSLDHDVVLGTVARVVKDRRLLGLCNVLVRSGGAHGRGLPIGNLTSQWFANLVLDRLDHFVKETLRVPGYVRYMDDFVLFADAKETLKDAHSAVANFLDDVLHLTLKHRVTRLAPAQAGLPFLGFRLFRGTVRVLPENLRRVRKRLRRRLSQLRDGTIDEAAFRSSLRSVAAHLAHGDTLHLRRRLFPSGLPPPASSPLYGFGPTAPPTG